MAAEPVKVLLIEDNSRDVWLLRRLLTNTLTSFTLQQADTLQAGLDFLKTGDIDVVMLDLNLPDSHGMETLESVRKQAGEVAIVVFSGDSNDSLAVKAMQFGVQDYLVKGETQGSVLVRSLRYAIQRKRTEKALQAALRDNSRLAAAIDSAASGVLICDPNQPDTPIVFANPTFCKITGYEREEVLGRNCRFLQGPGSDPAVMAEMRAAQAGRRPFRGVLLNYRKDGSTFRNELTINPVFDEAGELASFVGVQVDVSAQVEALERAQRSEENYRALFDANPLPSWVYDLSNLKFLAVNQAAVAHYGYSREEFLSMTILDIRPAEDAAALLAHVAEQEEGPGAAHSWRHLKKDGTLIEVESVDTGIVFAGQAARLVVVNDVTERRRTERALRESEARYERIASNVPGMVYRFVLHANGSVAMPFVSEGCREIFGVEPEEVSHDPRLCMNMIHPEDRPSHDESVEVSAAALQPWAWQGRIVRGDGEIRWVQAASRPERQPNGDTAWDGVVMDITERKCSEEHRQAKEEAERANLAKSEFLSRMSHELRTPLNAILGFGQLLELDALDERQAESVHQIVSGGRHLLKLVDEVLDIARVDSGSISLSPEPVGIHEIMHESRMLIGPLAEQNGIRLHTPGVTNPVARPGPHVTADRQRLKQVLLNLLSNAVKYNAPGGSVTLDYTLTASHLRLRVADTGPGIPAEKRERLFTPFDRLGAERGDVEGTGLGLALSKRLMEAMGGRLELEETPARAGWVDGAAGAAGANVGAVFRVELPLAVNPLDALTAAQAGAPKAPARCEPLPGGHTLLYIEDNLSNLALMERLIQLHPEARLLTAMQGTLGLDLARQHQPDLILLDVHLPDMPGWEVLARLRADESTRDIPVVIISADATERQAERLRQAGAYAYLTKPLDVRKFLAVVREALLHREEMGADGAG